MTLIFNNSSEMRDTYIPCVYLLFKQKVVSWCVKHPTQQLNTLKSDGNSITVDSLDLLMFINI